MSDDLDALILALRPMDGCDLFDRAVVAITELRAEVATLRARVVEVEAELREQAMQSLADLGQAQEAYEAQLAAEADAAALRAALTSFAFYDEEGGDVQHAWEIRYRDRFEDWIDFADIERARAALAPAMPEGE